MAALLHVSFSVRADVASAPRFAAFPTERSHVLAITRRFSLHLVEIAQPAPTHWYHLAALVALVSPGVAIEEERS